MMNPQSRRVILWRWAVFLLAGGYLLNEIVLRADYSAPGGPFRYLTIWALLLSFYSASRMLAVSERRSSRGWSTLVTVTAVANALVVLLYWRLWFEDPALVQSRGPIVWWREYYLHALGPVLQWIDALFVFEGIRRLWKPAIGLAVLFAGYIAWIELFVSRFNDFPTGSVTSGFPYPFLNSLDFAGRVEFYGTTTVTGFVFLGLFGALAWGVRRMRGQPAAKSA